MSTGKLAAGWRQLGRQSALAVPVRFFEEAELAEAEAWVRAAKSERARL